MQHRYRICCCLLGTLCVAAMAVAQGPDDAATPDGLAPEPAVAPLPEDIMPLSEDPTPMLPQVVGSGHPTMDCHGCRAHGVCRAHRHGPLCRLKSCLQESHWGYADQFCEMPLGACLYAHVNTQVANAVAARLVLYRYDFYDGILGDAFKLNHHGHKRLKEMVWMLQCNVYPIIVEHTPEEPGLAAARRDHVLNLLDKLDFPIPQDWVVVGEPVTPGLSGTEAVGIDQKMLQGVKSATKTTETTGLLFKQKTTEQPPTR